ncbi:hypothetical protein SM66_02164 [Klebsiella quasipneumoniae subsp. quasipneumoniae]|nr:hypothetical protein SM66_02164 [Klebsiella quasipneumoniae subsp. quasipneumoniae]VGD93665.1 Uncharacterised protein [Klebsiella quasipneumoniae]
MSSSRCCTRTTSRCMKLVWYSMMIFLNRNNALTKRMLLNLKLLNVNLHSRNFKSLMI